MSSIEQALTYLSLSTQVLALSLKLHLALLIVCVLALVGGGAVWAGVPSPRVRTFTPDTYNGGVQNWNVAQDEAGLIYVANSAGVLRYDGVRWATLLLPGNPTVRTVASAKDRVYAGGYGEFGYFESSAEAEPTWRSLASGLSPADRNEEIWNIEVLENGQVFFQSFGRLFLYDGQTLETIIPPGVMMFARARGNELVVPVTGRGIYLRKTSGDFALLPGSEALGEREVVSMVLSGDDLILGTADGVFLLHAGKLTPWNETLNEKLVGRKLNRLLVLQDGTLAVGTINSGLFIFDTKDGTLLRIDEASGLGNNTVLALFESNVGNLWLGLDRGLDLVVRSPAISFVTGKDRPPGTVYTASNYKGRAYFGTNQGLYLQNETSNGFTYDLVAGTSGQVWELQETPTGLLCGHNDGTFLIDGITAKKISDRSGGWMTTSLVAENREGQQLLQATYTGLQLLEWTDGEVVAEDIPGFNAPIRYLGWIAPGKLLAVHGSRGAFILRMSEDARRILSIDTLTDPILTQISAVPTREGVLLQGPQGRRLLKGDSLLVLDQFRNVPLRVNDYYLQGGGTAAWFVAEPDRVKVFKGDKMIAELPLRLRFPYPSIISWAEERWLFLLDEGYAEVNILPEETQVNPVILHSAHRWREGWRWLVAEEEPSELTYANNDLRFTYALPVFDRSVHYRSRLVGYSDDWSGWSETGDREFTNLPEGNYRFEVEANWFEGRAAVNFSVLPPWYRSTLAYGLYVMALLALLWVLYRLHLKRLATQARRMEVVRKRELQRERILARNRELKTDVKRKSRELANTTLTLAKKNEVLLSLREEIARARRQPSHEVDHRKIQHLIDRNLNNEEDWAIFESHFNEVHEAFLKRLRKAHPELTTGDLKLAAYLRMDLSSKEIAPLLHISVRGVENKRYRLRKKLNIEGGGDLNRYLLDF